MDKLRSFLRVLLGGLIGMFVSGVAMTAIGQPTSTHKLSSSGNTFWHILLVFHILFLIGLTISAISILVLSVKNVSSVKTRAIVGILAVVFGIISGVLVVHKIHPSIFLFCMALAFLLIGATYGPIAGHGGP
jgi:hypothetical protein